jgi:hypothetical protein
VKIISSMRVRAALMGLTLLALALARSATAYWD